MADPGGQPGNQNAAKGKQFYGALQRAITQDNGKRLRECAETLLTNAAAGEPWAVKELADRLDGKPAQAITGADDGPLRVLIQASAHDETL